MFKTDKGSGNYGDDDANRDICKVDVDIVPSSMHSCLQASSCNLIKDNCASATLTYET